MRRVFRFALALLRELGDENAYRRHLEMHGRVHSGAERWHRSSVTALRDRQNCDEDSCHFGQLRTLRIWRG